MIYRYRLDILDTHLDLPADHELLSIAPARDGYYIDLWARVESNKPTVRREIQIYGTGHPMPPMHNLAFLGTAVMSDHLVWHVFAGSVGPVL